MMNSGDMMRLPRVRPMVCEKDRAALKAACAENGWMPIRPTHLVERGDGELIGYLGLSQINLLRCGLRMDVKARDSLQVIQVVDNLQRCMGNEGYMTLVQPDSRFVKVFDRLGFTPVGVGVLAVKSFKKEGDIYA